MELAVFTLGRLSIPFHPLELGKLPFLTRCRVNTRISAEVTKPFEERKFDGIFTITTELSPLASPAFEVGRCVGSQLVLLFRSLTLRI